MEQQKTNYGIRIDLLKLNNAFMRNMTGRTATKRCIIIPVDDNDSIFLGEKGCMKSTEERKVMLMFVGHCAQFYSL